MPVNQYFIDHLQDTIEWLLVSKDAHQAMVTLPTPWTLEEPYMVGMSALGPDGRSSGIRWTECFHSAVQRMKLLTLSHLKHTATKHSYSPSIHTLLQFVLYAISVFQDHKGPVSTYSPLERGVSNWRQSVLLVIKRRLLKGTPMDIALSSVLQMEKVAKVKHLSLPDVALEE